MLALDDPLVATGQVVIVVHQILEPPGRLGRVLGDLREEVEEPVIGGDELEAHDAAKVNGSRHVVSPLWSRALN